MASPNSNNKRPENSANGSSNSFTRRAPSKRQVRVPEQPQFFHLNMIESDSEDDEDFVAFSDDEDMNSSDDGSDAGNRNQIAMESSSSESEEDKEDQVENGKEEAQGNAASNLQAAEKTEEGVTPVVDKTAIESSQGEIQQVKDSSNLEKENDQKVLELSKNNEVRSIKKPDVIVCGICLESESTEEDELVECDHCGITVHEGCYGDTEESVAESKSDSDAATEPWFCDLCKAKAKGICELCPNKGGILKQTATGQWVHLICALYVPGTGFRDVDKLQTVVLDDIQSSRWGARWCLLCEDQRLSKTGVCIGCDAGLCKNYFHAICAQKHGLLIEIPDAGHLDDDEVDPLYAHCKMHTDKAVMKTRKKRWLAFETHVKNFKVSDDPEEKARIDEAFDRACKEYEDFVNSIEPVKPSGDNKPRLLSTCPEACESLIRKAELLGSYADHSDVHDMDAAHTGKLARGGAMFAPNLSVGFINHFFKREKWLEGYDQKQASLQENINNNQEKQKLLQETWDNLKVQLEKLASGKDDLVAKITSIHSALELIVGGKLSRPEVLSRKKKVKKETIESIEEFIHICTNCGGTENQQLMAQCDKCHNYYHIHCLDPPLTTLPKKGSKWIWHCTDCDESESSDESVDFNEPIAKRKKRVSNAPKKFTPVDEKKELQKKIDGVSKKSGYERRGRPRKIKPAESPVSIESEVPRPKNTNPAKKGRKSVVKVEEIFDDCSVCSKEGNRKNMVSCDQCRKTYHFGCCEPKLKANPKRRGYSWICTECTETSEEEETDGVDEKASNAMKNGDAVIDDAMEVDPVANDKGN